MLIYRYIKPNSGTAGKLCSRKLRRTLRTQSYTDDIIIRTGKFIVEYTDSEKGGRGKICLLPDRILGRSRTRNIASNPPNTVQSADTDISAVSLFWHLTGRFGRITLKSTIRYIR